MDYIQNPKDTHISHQKAVALLHRSWTKLQRVKEGMMELVRTVDKAGEHWFWLGYTGTSYYLNDF